MFREQANYYNSKQFTQKFTPFWLTIFGCVRISSGPEYTRPAAHQSHSSERGSSRSFTYAALSPLTAFWSILLTLKTTNLTRSASLWNRKSKEKYKLHNQRIYQTVVCSEFLFRTVEVSSWLGSLMLCILIWDGLNRRKYRLIDQVWENSYFLMVM